MSMARNSKSIDPAAPKKDLLVVLLEGIHASAVVALRHAGYTRIVSHVKSLAGSELRAALAELVLAQIIMLMRGIPEKNAILHRGRWVKSAAHSFEVRGRARQNDRAGAIGGDEARKPPAQCIARYLGRQRCTRCRA